MSQTFEREVVFDSNVIIDFKAGGIREDIFLSHVVRMHRAVYQDEMKKERKYLAPHLLDQKFKIIERSEEIDCMVNFLKEHHFKRVGRFDLLGLASALVSDRRFATGDKRLRGASHETGAKLTGTIGIACDIIRDKKRTPDDMLTAFELMKQRRRRLPWALALKEIGELRRGKDV